MQNRMLIPTNPPYHRSAVHRVVGSAFVTLSLILAKMNMTCAKLVVQNWLFTVEVVRL